MKRSRETGPGSRKHSRAGRIPGQGTSGVMLVIARGSKGLLERSRRAMGPLMSPKCETRVQEIYDDPRLDDWDVDLDREIGPGEVRSGSEESKGVLYIPRASKSA